MGRREFCKTSREMIWRYEAKSVTAEDEANHAGPSRPLSRMQKPSGTAGTWRPWELLMWQIPKTLIMYDRNRSVTVIDTLNGVGVAITILVAEPELP